MNIDPRLEKLQNLISEKRVQQGLDNPPRVVGKPGNSRFAEAARRVEERRSFNNNNMSVGNNFYTTRSGKVEVSNKNGNIRNNPLNDVTLGINQSNVRNSQTHLGKYLDLYA